MEREIKEQNNYFMPPVCIVYCWYSQLLISLEGQYWCFQSCRSGAEVHPSDVLIINWSVLACLPYNLLIWATLTGCRHDCMTLSSQTTSEEISVKNLDLWQGLIYFVLLDLWRFMPIPSNNPFENQTLSGTLNKMKFQNKPV